MKLPLCIAITSVGMLAMPVSVSASDLQNIATAIQAVGLNCPNVVRYETINEDAYGQTLSVTCSARDGESSWGIRTQISPSGEARFAPWDENPPNWRVRPAPSGFTLKRR